ncbi:Phage terminase, large subunit [Smithella sp. ME-1]|uniref:Phage terminase, large subunit n=1 Tax=hydrocarbon metagenome TaxID=938273 RepID=A0A0W8FPX6_9ZZZZ|nr:Phage terminase, large subunit [Smithella sp. ME-1]
MEETNQTDFEKARKSTSLLLGYQQRWVADQSDVKVGEKSRRVGFSWAEAADDTLYASEKGNGEKRNVWYIGYTKDMALEFINDCANWARAYKMAVSSIDEYEEPDEDDRGIVKEQKILAYKITFESGWRITALSSRPTNLRGKQGRVVIDEAAFHDDLPGLLKAAMALLMWGGQVRIISTHFGDNNEFNSLVQDIRAGKKPYSLHRVTFDEALTDGLYKRICEVLKREWSPEAEATWRQGIIDSYGEDADEELFCIPSQGTGVFLTRAVIEKCLSADIPVIRYEQPTSFAALPDHIRSAEVKDWCEEIIKPHLTGLSDEQNSIFGEDFARTGDLTVLKIWLENQKANWRELFQLELRNMPFQQQEQILYYICDRLSRFRYGALDARGNGQYLAERAMQRYGEGRIAQVMITEAWYRENMPAYKAAFEDQTITMARDADVIEDHRAFKVIKGVAKLPEIRQKGKDNKKRHGDSGIAGAMACFATRQEWGGDIEFESTGHTRTTASQSMANFIGH